MKLFLYNINVESKFFLFILVKLLSWFWKRFFWLLDSSCRFKLLIRAFHLFWGLIWFMFVERLFWLNFANLKLFWLFDCLTLRRRLLLSSQIFSSSSRSWCSLILLSSALRFYDWLYNRSFRSYGLARCVWWECYSTRFIWIHTFPYRLYFLLSCNCNWFCFLLNWLNHFSFYRSWGLNFIFISIEKRLQSLRVH